MTLTRKLLFQTAVAAVTLLLAGCAQSGGRIGSQTVARSSPLMQIKAGEISTPVAGIEHEDMMNPIVLQDALTNIDALEKTFDWKPFRPGVEIAHIYSTPDGGPAAAFLKYQPGASVPLHMHGGYEHIFILKGSQVDRSGEHGAGTVVINPPGSSHNVTSPKGCIVLIMWDKPVILAK